jgi:small subunit ribosomal protein S27Ae
MADKKPAGKDSGAKGGAPKKKKGKSQSIYYTTEGDKAVRNRKFCPKCGTGVFLAEHASRVTCGKCGYTEFKRK